MMPPHLSILITPAENGDSKRRGRQKKVTEEEREREREKPGNSSKQGLCSPS